MSGGSIGGLSGGALGSTVGGLLAGIPTMGFGVPAGVAVGGAAGSALGSGAGMAYDATHQDIPGQPKMKSAMAPVALNASKVARPKSPSFAEIAKPNPKQYAMDILNQGA